MFYQQYVGAGAGSSSLNCMYYEIALHGGCVMPIYNLLDGELSCQHISIPSEQSMHACLCSGPMDHSSLFSQYFEMEISDIYGVSKTKVRRRYS